MRRKNRAASGLICSLLSILAARAAAAPAQRTFYVSPGGDDRGQGTEGKPFATLLRAKAAVRDAGPNQARKVVVGGGAYYLKETLTLEKEDSGTTKVPVVWQAAPGEEVRLVGGRAIPPEAFGPVDSSRVIARLDPAARGKVVPRSPGHTRAVLQRPADDARSLAQRRLDHDR